MKNQLNNHYIEESYYSKALEFFVENGIVLNNDQLNSLKEAVAGALGALGGAVAGGIATGAVSGAISAAEKRREFDIKQKQKQENNQNQNNDNDN